MDSGLRASAGRTRDRGARRWHIADSAIGIRQGDLSRLFLPFRQVDSALMQLHEGTGLGPAICSRWLALLDGSIDVDATPGEGSPSTVTLRASGARNR